MSYSHLPKPFGRGILYKPPSGITSTENVRVGNAQTSDFNRHQRPDPSDLVQRRAFFGYKDDINSKQPTPLVLTLKFDDETFSVMNDLRKQYFPKHLNFLSAHISLFHNLPEASQDVIYCNIEDLCKNTPPFPLPITGPLHLGKGVALTIKSEELNKLHRRLKSKWKSWLSPQDLQGFRSHVTIQNKVTPEESKILYQKLLSEWKPQTGKAVGLSIWRYMGGPWAHLKDFEFMGSDFKEMDSAILTLDEKERSSKAFKKRKKQARNEERAQNKKWRVKQTTQSENPLNLDNLYEPK